MLTKKLKQKILFYLEKPLNYFFKPNREAFWVFGFQKSGTSAIANLMAHMSDQSVTIDPLSLRWPNNIAIQKGQINFVDQVIEHSYQFSKDIIKDPGATFYIDKVNTFFLLKKYVHVIRNPIDNIRSILNRLKIPGDLDSINLAEVHPNWRHKFTDGNNYIDDLCHLWLEANGHSNYLKSERCILVKYEEFIQNKIKTISSLCEQAGFPIKNDISHIMNNQFQPKGDSTVHVNSFFKGNMSKILDICGPKMEEYGYELKS